MNTQQQVPAIGGVPHITPLRVRSSSRENAGLYPPQANGFNNSFVSSVNTSHAFMEPGGLDYIGLRANKDHASCNSHRLHIAHLPTHHSDEGAFPSFRQPQLLLPQTQYNPQSRPPIHQSRPSHNQATNQPDYGQMMNSINGELQRFIDVELRHTLMDMKNQLFEQQRGFEKQICEHIDNLQRDLANRQPEIIVQQTPAEPLSSSVLEPLTKQFALQDDLKVVEGDLTSLAGQVEDSLNKHGQVVEQALDSQQQAIEEISAEQARQAAQQAEVNHNLQNAVRDVQRQGEENNNKVDQLEERVDGIEERVTAEELKNQQQDKSIKDQTVTLNNLEAKQRDQSSKAQQLAAQVEQHEQRIFENEGQTRETNQKAEEALREVKRAKQRTEQVRGELIEDLSREKEQLPKARKELQTQLDDLQDKVNQKFAEHQRDNQYDFDLMKKRLDEINQKLALDINQEKLQDLEKLIKQQDNLSAMLDIKKRLQELEDEVQNQILKQERDLKQTGDQLKYDFQEDQRRQDRALHQLSEDCDFKIDQTSKYIDKVNLEKTQQIEKLQEDLEGLRKFLKEDQFRQDKFVEDLKQQIIDQLSQRSSSLDDESILSRLKQLESDVQQLSRIPMQIQPIEERINDIESELEKQNQEYKKQNGEVLAHQGSLQESQQAQDQALKSLQNDQEAILNELDALKKKLEQEVKLSSLDNQRLERKLGTDLDNAMAQVEENQQALSQAINKLTDKQLQDEQAIMDQEEMVKKQEGQISILEKAICDLEKSIEDLQTHQVGQDNGFKQLQAALEERQIQLDNLQKQIELENYDRQALKDHLEKEMKEKNQKIQDNSSGIKEANIKIQELQKKFQESNQQQKEATHAINQDLNEIKTRELEQDKGIQELKSQLENLKTQEPEQRQMNPSVIDSLKSDILQDIEALKQQLQALEAANNQVVMKVQKKNQKVNAGLDQGRQKQTSIEEEVQALKKKFDELQPSFDYLQNQVQDLESLKPQLDEFKQTQENELGSLQQQLQELETQNQQNMNELQDQLQKLDEKQQQSMEDLAEQVNTFVGDVDSQLKILGENDQTHQEITNALQDQLNALKDKEGEQDARLDALEQKTQDLDKQIDEQKQDSEIFKENICGDLDTLENQLVEALQKDTAQMVYKEQVEPLEKRVTLLEEDKNMGVSQVVEEQIVKSPPKMTQEEIMEQEHRRLLSEMKRRRLWYLRKTPQDYIIEEIMLKNRCTQEKAEQIYLRQLEKNKLIKADRQSPEQERASSRAGGRGKQEEGGNFLGIKHIYENIIHAASPSRAGSRAGSRSGSRQFSAVSHLEPGREIIQPVNVMRQPQSPLKGEYVGEPDYAEGNRLSPVDPRGRRGQNLGDDLNTSAVSSKAPYIVISSPLHEETIVTETIQTVNVNKKPFTTSTQYKGDLPKQHRVGDTNFLNANINVSDIDDESNIDFDELDNNNDQMRQNLDTLIESPPTQEDYYRRRRDDNKSVSLSGVNQFQPFRNMQQDDRDLNRQQNQRGHQMSSTNKFPTGFLNEIEQYSPPQNNQLKSQRQLNQPTSSMFNSSTNPLNFNSNVSNYNKKETISYFNQNYNDQQLQSPNIITVKKKPQMQQASYQMRPEQNIQFNQSLNKESSRSHLLDQMSASQINLNNKNQIPQSQVQSQYNQISNLISYQQQDSYEGSSQVNNSQLNRFEYGDEDNLQSHNNFQNDYLYQQSRQESRQSSKQQPAFNQNNFHNSLDLHDSPDQAADLFANDQSQDDHSRSNNIFAGDNSHLEHNRNNEDPYQENDTYQENDEQEESQFKGLMNLDHSQIINSQDQSFPGSQNYDYHEYIKEQK